MVLLVGILAIDRDIVNIKKLIKSIPNNIDIILITRYQDIKIINYINQIKKIKIILINNYEIKERHNTYYIGLKRQIIINYAKQNNYNYLLFCDSDIILPKNCIKNMIDISIQNNDCVVCGIYPIVWASNKAIVFTKKGLTEFNDLDKNSNIIVGGFGCTLINSKYFNIPIKIKHFHISEDKSLQGEDFGWYIELYKKNILVKPYLKSIIIHNYITSDNEVLPYSDKELSHISQLLLNYFKKLNL